MKLSGEREIYWEEKGRNGMEQIISHKKASKRLFSAGKKRGGERKT